MVSSFLSKYKDLGILLLRLGIGLSFVIIHGWPKLSGGPEFWAKLGQSMGSLGIKFAPVFWGFMSAVTECIGGAFIALGLFTRTTAFFLVVNMIVATSSMLARQDPWNKVIYPIEILFVFVGLLFIGPGSLSLDRLIFKKRT